jgi:GMP synthase-like glutamine amidotransferase
MTMSAVRGPKVAIVDNSIDPTLYQPVEHWSAHLGVEWEAFRAPEFLLPDLGKGYTHLILTGSEASVLEREKWVDEEVEFIRDAFRNGLSILGSCYGHQLLALALAGPSHVRRCREPEIGWIPVDVQKNTPLLGRPGRAYSFSLHFDEVTSLADPFVTLAATAICPIQAFGYKGKNIWGLQIHPEIDVPAARALMEDLLPVNPKVRPLYEKALASEPRDSGLIVRIVKTFLAIFP